MEDDDVTYSSRHIEQLLQCSVCLDRFKIPKLLPCQHTYCQSPCLEQLINPRTRMIKCPECRADHLVPRGGTSAFPNNITVMGFMDLPRLSLGEPRIPALNRNEGGVSSVKLSETDAYCKKSSGPSATETCSRYGGYSYGNDLGIDHPVVAQPPPRTTCSSCFRSSRLSQCHHCQQQICDICIRQHMEQVKVEIERMIYRIKRGMPKISSAIDDIGAKGGQAQQRCESAKTEINEMFERLIRDFKIRQRSLLDQIDTFLISELENLRSQQESFEVELASLASFCDSSESAVGHGSTTDGTELMQLHEQCEENCNITQNFEGSHMRRIAVRQIDINADIETFSETIAAFGEIEISARPGSRGANIDNRSIGSRLASRLVDLARPTSSRYQSYTSRPSSRNMDTDYGLSSALGTHSPLTQTHSPMTSSPTTERRRLLPSYLNRDPLNDSHRDLLASDSDNYDDRNTINTSRTNTAHQPRRRPRREHHSDTRLGLVSGEEGILSRYRRRSLGGLSPPREEELFDDDVEGAGRNRPYSRNATAGDTTAPRPPSRLEVPPENSSSTSSQEDLSTRNSYQRPQRQRNNQPPSSSSSQNQGSGRSSNQAEPRNRYNQKGRAIVRFGSRGNGFDEFTWPRGVAVSPIDDTIFIADSSNHRVQVFDSSGDYRRTFGSYGQEEGEFDCLAGITVNNLGQVIVSDRYNHRIQIFDHSFNFVTSFGEEGSLPGQLCYPWGIACDNMGFIYVCDKENNRIQVFQSNGAFVRCFGEQGDDLGQLDNPQYVAVSPDNKVYVSDSSNHRIQVFSMYGDFLFTFGDSGTGNGEVKYPRGIAIDEQGFVAVADSGNNRVQIFRPNGIYYSMFGSWGNENGQFKALEGLAILANGNIVVSDRENHRIQIF
ncbi:hypothetical protein LOTGIDRAFT_170883 [Lottia gigantea]|uniref:RING-type domain-containing protein n=1 Tax=Lottia gigantea TaxID=225164 RepID=V4B1Q8_LOTGI|nr:hypothetical protein LOTGIDRAFT_170883 [Lottia gigantea]ESP04293.1 hypothetical protein LOTGIDRAFT_170883 [Lottia gigantea]